MNKATLFSSQQVEILRKAYAGVSTIDPCGDYYKNLIKFLDKQTPEMLQMLVNANIKFVSALARNRI
jgi:hypothetical protein